MNLSSAAGVRQRRNAYLSLALRRARPGSGSSRDFLQTRLWKRRFRPADLDDLESLIPLGQLEYRAGDDRR
jgi:hypothetical protein